MVVNVLRPLVALVVATMMPAVGAPLAQAEGCQFVLGFAALHAAIPAIVGECVDDEGRNPANGDAPQHAKKGLLVWRKADTFTAFADGSHTWAAGPYGIQDRLNAQRFPWEANPDGRPVVGPASPTVAHHVLGRCHTADLSIAQDEGSAGGGLVVATFRVQSHARGPCALYGFPGAQLLDANKRPLRTSLRWGTAGYQGATGVRMGTAPASLVTLQPGGSGYFALLCTDVPAPGDVCLPSRYALIRPPDETTRIMVAAQLAPCGGRLTALPILPNRAALP